MSKTNKKSTGRLGMIVSTMLYCLIGAAGGFMLVQPMYDMLDAGAPLWQAVLMLAGMMIVLYATIYVQMVLHEAGHLLFGLLTGYRFSSFRIGSVMLLRSEGKLTVKRLQIAGTGGQCLMIAPAWRDEGIPYVLYNLGGILVNLLTAALCAGLSLLIAAGSIPRSILLLVAISGVMIAVMNGIPMMVGPVTNDGYNALMLGRSKASLRAFWQQFEINRLQAEGMRLSDMPEELFAPIQDAPQDMMSGAVAALHVSRLMDSMAFDEAQAQAEQLLTENALQGVMLYAVQAECLYCELMHEARVERLQALYDQPLKKYLKSMPTSPSTQRIYYAWALLHDHDEAAAAKAQAEFDKYSPRYPYQQEVAMERELMRLAKARYEERARQA